MSSSDRPIAIGVISGFLRAPLLKACSCLWMYCSCWPARLGHSGFALLPLGPWQAMHAVALDSPFSAEPAASAPALDSPGCKARRAGQARKASFMAKLQGSGALKGAELYTSGPAAACRARTPRNAAVPRSPVSSRSAWQPHQFPADEGAEVAFAGRSNAGKSSALNAIAGRKDLARTSKTPGRTQLINFFALDGAQRLVDLPGYGYAKVPERIREHWQELLTRYVEARASLVGLVIVMDSRRPLTDFDVQMLDWSRSATALPAHVLLTKADKLSRGESSTVLKQVRDAGRGRGDGPAVLGRREDRRRRGAARSADDAETKKSPVARESHRDSVTRHGDGPG